MNWFSDKMDAIRLNMTALKHPVAFGVKVPQEILASLRVATHECGRVNAELQLLGPLLARGDVSDLARVARVFPGKNPRGGPAAHARAIVCGLDSMVLLVINLNIDSDFHARKPGGVAGYLPVDVDVVLESPSWLEPADVFAVSYRGIAPLDAPQSAGLRTFHFDRLSGTAAVVLTADKNLRARMQDSLRAMQERLRKAGVELP